jgi:hypothetical protein
LTLTVRAWLCTNAPGVTGKRSPVDMVRWQSSTCLVTTCVWAVLCHTTITNPPGINTAKLIVDSGVIGYFCAACKAFELHGAGAVDDASPGLYIHALVMLQSLDLTAPEAKPIAEQLRQIPSSLKFMVEPAHNLIHIRSVGMMTASMAAFICASVFGKEEAGDEGPHVFEFSEEIIDSLLTTNRAQFDGSLSIFFAKTLHWLRPIEMLCVSDANKSLLVKSAALIPLLLSALFLEDDGGVNSGLDDAVKAAIQIDAASCFLQIAVFGPAREILAADGAAMGALHALADGHARSPEAKLSAAGAILAIEGRSSSHEPEPMPGGEHSVGGRHLMVSCTSSGVAV